MSAASLGYRAVFDGVLTRVDAERAHHWGMAAARGLDLVPGQAAAVQSLAAVRDAALRTSVWGLEFPSPVGLAAGFDKDATAVDAFAALGFGFVEVGTVTALPQPGNPQPRLARLPRDLAVVNRMGFNNSGAVAVARRLRALRERGRRPEVVVGVNIGKSKVATPAEAIDDYVLSARALAPFADYLVVNVSSPNTPGLRDLQAVERLEPVLDAVRMAADGSAGCHVPLLVKIAPDLSDDDVVAVGHLAARIGLDGLVATNTTIDRSGLRSSAREIEAAGTGGLSGVPLRHRSREVLGLLRATVADDVVLVSAGGISTAPEAWARIRAGATLVQGYTGLVYRGPTWPRDLAVGLVDEARRTGYPTVQAAVGVDVRGGRLTMADVAWGGRPAVEVNADDLPTTATGGELA